jgi:hypothetical protein
MDALERGYLVNHSQRERSYDLDVGDALPTKKELLPSREELAEVFGGVRSGVRSPTEHENPMGTGDSGECSVCSVDPGEQAQNAKSGAYERSLGAEPEPIVSDTDTFGGLGDEHPAGREPAATLGLDPSSPLEIVRLGRPCPKHPPAGRWRHATSGFWLCAECYPPPPPSPGVVIQPGADADPFEPMASHGAEPSAEDDGGLDHRRNVDGVGVDEVAAFEELLRQDREARP